MSTRKEPVEPAIPTRGSGEALAGKSSDFFVSLLGRYAAGVSALTSDFSLKNLIDCLHLRDAIETCLRQDAPVNEQRVSEIIRTDKQLQSLGPRAYDLRRDLVGVRRCVRPRPDAWWWFLDHCLGKGLGWVERISLTASLILFPLSLGLALELARRYGSNGVGWESLLPIAVTLLGSLSVGGLMSIGVRDRVTSLLETNGWSIRWRPLAVCLVFTLMGLIVVLWRTQSTMSAYFNHRGISHLTQPRGPQKQLSEARIDFERAVRFDSTNAVAHYNLGRVFEDLLQDERAATEYQTAFDAGLDLAGNNLGHVLLLRKEYDRAAVVLQRSSADSATIPDPELRYSRLKNLGWARWGQNRFSEARTLLEEAIRLKPGHAEAHCLLAKTLGAMGDPAAESQWRSCVAFASQNLGNPTEDIWIGEARAYLDSTGRWR